MANRAATEVWLQRAGRSALLVGSFSFIVHIVLRSVVTAGPALVDVSTASSWVPINLFGFAGALLVLLGLPAILPRVIEAGRGAGVGLLLLAASWVFFGVFLSLYGLVVLPWLAESAPFLLTAPPPPAFVLVFVGALATWIVGAVLVAIPLIRQRTQPVWVGYALLASGILAAVGNLVLAPSGPSSNLALNLFSNIGPIPMLVAFSYLSRSA